MPNTNGYKVCGPTIGLSVAATSHAAVTVDVVDNSANALLVCNTTTGDTLYVNVTSTQLGVCTLTAAAAATIPGDGTAGSLPILAYAERAIAGLRFPVSVTAIGSVAGPSLMTVTPIVLL